MLKQAIKTALKTIYSLKSPQHNPRIIYYHSIGDINVRSQSRRLFEQQMRWLSENEYQTLLVRNLKDLGVVNPKTIVITFDDGYYDNIITALPILKKCNHKATFFVSAEFIKDGMHQRARKEDRLYHGLKMMSMQDLQLLIDSGMEVGSHGLTHRMFSRLSIAEQKFELEKSKYYLEKGLNETITSFAYPNGQKGAISEYANNYAQKIGYNCICTTLWGTISKPNSLVQPRCEISSNDSLDEFKAKLMGRRDYRYSIDRLFDKSKAWD